MAVLYNGIILPKAPQLREYPVQEKYGYTETTVNSTGSESVFIQISDCWVNPLKHTDPDGRTDDVVSTLPYQYGKTDYLYNDLIYRPWLNDGQVIVSEAGLGQAGKFLAYKIISPGTWLEFGSSAPWGWGLSSLMGLISGGSLLAGSIGWGLGFLNPAVSIVVGLIATLAGGQVANWTSVTDSLTVNIKVNGAWSRTWGSIVTAGSDYQGILPHERGHFLQSLVLGPFYWLVIGLPSTR